MATKGSKRGGKRLFEKTKNNNNNTDLRVREEENSRDLLNFTSHIAHGRRFSKSEDVAVLNPAATSHPGM